MKKQFLFLTFMLFASMSIAQGLKPAAQKIYDKKQIGQVFRQTQQLFAVNTSTTVQANQLANIVSHATVMDFNSAVAQNILASKPDNITLSIPAENGSTMQLELYKANIFTPDFSVVEASDNQPVAYSGGVHYQGIISGDNSSVAAISIFNDEVMGMISTPSNGNIVLGKLEHDAMSRHILYNDRNLHAQPPTECFTTATGSAYVQKDFQTPSISSVACIRLYWEVNYDIFTGKGSVTAATNYVTGLFNQSAILYTNDNIPVELSQVFVWDVASPYTATSTSSLLNQFQSNVNSFNGDLGHLLGYAGGGGIAASTNGLCNSNTDYKQCYSGIGSSFSNVPTFSWSVEVVTHEQGHLMGSRHTHDCAWNGNSTKIDSCGDYAGYASGSCSVGGGNQALPVGGGTIMSYCHLVNGIGINFSLGFGSQPRTVILNKYNAASCLTACTGVTCNAPTGMATASITTTSATLNWTAASGAVSYNIRYRIVGAGSWTSTTSATNSKALSGLAPTTNYEWQVQTVCTAGSSGFTLSTNFTTLTPPCNAPTNMTTTGITGSSATFNWAAASGAVSYNVRYRIAGTSTWTTVNTTSASYTASGIAAGANYEWQVQTVCAAGSSSFTNSTNFTTSPPNCLTPTALQANNITNVSAQLNWLGTVTADTFLIKYVAHGGSSYAWKYISGIPNVISTVISGLSPNTQYDWWVRSICTGQSGSAYQTTPATFTTLSTAIRCIVPYNSGATSITNNSALTTWSIYVAADTFRVRYSVFGTTNYLYKDVNGSGGSSTTLTGLLSNTTYQFQVSSKCVGVSGAYSASYSFTTLNTAVACITPYGLSTTNIAGTSAVVNWTPLVTADSFLVKYWRTGTTAYYYKQISGAGGAFNTQLTGLAASSGYSWQVRSICTGTAATAYSAVATFATTAFARISLTENILSLKEVALYPNPANENLTVEFTSNTKSNVFMNAFNLLGEKILMREYEVQEGLNNIPLNTATLAKGIYILELISAEEINRQRFIIER